MKKKNVWKQTIAAAAVAALLCSCGSAGKNTYEMTAESAAYDTAAADAGGVMTANQTYAYAEAEAVAEEPMPEAGSSEISVPEGAVERKLIRTVNISAETEAFDELVPALQKQVETLGGYIESISVYDIDTYYVEDSLQKRRNADITARVPKEKLDGFLAQVGEQTNITSRSENVEDVTLQYVDLDSHKKALLVEQERLFALLEQAESVEDIIAIEGRLSEVRYQIESMESQLRTYDNKIDYSTVYLSLEEVRKYSPAQTATVWQRIGNGFRKSLSDIGYGIRDLAIGFVIDIPYIVLWIILIAVAALVLRILRRIWKKRAAKRGTGQEQRKLQFRLPFVVRGEKTETMDGKAEAEGRETEEGNNDR